MNKLADVLDVLDQNTAKVMLYKHKKCHGCGSCNKHMHPGSIFEASNPVGARKGEMVDVRVRKKFSAEELFIVYILPVLSFFVGLFLGGMAFPGQNGGIFAVALAFLLLAASVVVNVIYKKKYHPVYKVEVVKRITPAEPRL